MSKRGQTTMAMKSWDEKPYDEFDGGRKLARAKVAFSYTGDLEGESALEYLMAYSPNGDATFVGLERIVGRVGGRAGSFVIQHTGAFENQVAKDTWFIVPDSGTGELQGLTGKGDFSISGEGPFPLTFEYELK